MRRVLVTQGTERLVRQAAKRLRLLAACASGRAGDSGPRCLRPAGAWPHQSQHDKEPQESQDQELIVKEGWNHGIAPLYSGVTGAYYSILGSVELSADWRDTTWSWHHRGSPRGHRGPSQWGDSARPFERAAPVPAGEQRNSAAADTHPRHTSWHGRSSS